MQEQQLYEYAVVHIVPRVERGEFINAGIIVFCKKTGFLNCAIHIDARKLKCMDEKADLDYISKNLDAFAMIAKGNPESSSPIARLDAPSRFRWLTATRSTIIQCSKVHPGLTNDLERSLHRLMQEIVL